MSKQLSGDQMECMESALKSLDFAMQGGVPWMNVTFCIVNGRIRMDRTTCNFPYCDFEKALELLAKDLKQENGLDTTPLPVAELPEMAASE